MGDNLKVSIKYETEYMRGLQDITVYVTTRCPPELS